MHRLRCLLSGAEHGPLNDDHNQSGALHAHYKPPNRQDLAAYGKHWDLACSMLILRCCCMLLASTRPDVDLISAFFG
jgi:hypothetical protein